MKVKLFGPLVERVGSAEVDLDATTAGDVVDAIGVLCPDAVTLLERCAVAVNLEVVDPDHAVGPDDEVALLPPTSGGAPILVGVRTAPDPQEARAAVASPSAGATVSFVGTVRDHNQGRTVSKLTYSAYEAMADKVMEDIAVEASERFGLHGVAVLHAAGSLEVGDVTFVVACSAPHRQAAFDGCRFLTDTVKERVPVWKLETTDAGDRWL